nr:hypothetical protein [Tanacetum cinerariifolium]
MDDPNITMEEYIRLEEEKARRRAIVFNDSLTSEVTLSYEPTDLENDNDKVNMPLFPSPVPTVSYFDDLDLFEDFEKEFPVIVYNDALTSKLDFLTEATSTVDVVHVVLVDVSVELLLTLFVLLILSIVSGGVVVTNRHTNSFELTGQL